MSTEARERVMEWLKGFAEHVRHETDKGREPDYAGGSQDLLATLDQLSTSEGEDKRHECPDPYCPSAQYKRQPGSRKRNCLMCGTPWPDLPQENTL